MKNKNVIGWLKFNESMDNKEKNECTCKEEPCSCEETNEKKKANPFAKMNAKKKEKGDDKEKAPKKGDKKEGGKKKLSAAQMKLPWNKGK